MTITEDSIKEFHKHYTIEVENYIKSIAGTYNEIWSTNKCAKQLAEIEKLLLNAKTDNVLKIEEDDYMWQQMYMRENPEAKEGVKTPLVTDGKYYGDEKIHIHPFVCEFEDDLYNGAEEQVFFEIMKKLVNPAPTNEEANPELKGISEYIRYGIIAYCMINNDSTCFGSRIPDKYKSNLEYVTEIIKNVSDPRITNELLFNCNIDQILSYTANKDFSPKKLYKEIYKGNNQIVQITDAPTRKLVNKEERRAGYLSSFLYVLIIIAAGVIVAFLLR